jgi:hypothetical protein
MLMQLASIVAAILDRRVMSRRLSLNSRKQNIVACTPPRWRIATRGITMPLAVHLVTIQTGLFGTHLCPPTAATAQEVTAISVRRRLVGSLLKGLVAPPPIEGSISRYAFRLQGKGDGIIFWPPQPRVTRNTAVLRCRCRTWVKTGNALTEQNISA